MAKQLVIIQISQTAWCRELSYMWQPHTSCILITNLAALEIDFSIRAHAAPIARRGIEYCIIYSSDCWRKKCDINETQEVEGERAVRFFLCSALWSARARCREIWFSAGEHDSSVPRLKNVLLLYVSWLFSHQRSRNWKLPNLIENFIWINEQLSRKLLSVRLFHDSTARLLIY